MSGATGSAAPPAASDDSPVATRPRAGTFTGARLRPRLSLLDAAAIDYVHEQSLRLLAEVGVRVPLARAQALAPWPTTRPRSSGFRAIS